MILHIDRAWLLDLAHRSVPGDPDVLDFGTLQAAVARHADKVMDRPVYAQVHHRAAALMHQLIRVPALEYANELFGAIVAAAYLSASGAMVTVDHKQAADLAERIAQDGLDVREVADEIKVWTSPSGG
ncbi:fic family toxin-antitoxin system, toxin component [Streptomyces sp. NPDC059688]|uniref:fic family toxin-antitoxin system, toxin component n=1 Tax=Streptomyces sp. NPDC059688 TaxID=3346906 RepID=UPI0036C8BEBE